jgi:hypothetical protein
MQLLRRENSPLVAFLAKDDFLSALLSPFHWATVWRAQIGALVDQNVLNSKVQD